MVNWARQHKRGRTAWVSLTTRVNGLDRMLIFP